MSRELDRARDQLASLGDPRPGRLAAHWRKCGKPGCHCAREGARGHGPSYVLVRSVDGKTRSVRIGPDDVEAYGRFLELASGFLEASAALAAARLQRGREERAQGA